MVPVACAVYSPVLPADCSSVTILLCARNSPLGWSVHASLISTFTVSLSSVLFGSFASSVLSSFSRTSPTSHDVVFGSMTISSSAAS